ncbi:hypothetical protein HK405_012512, partial [Cladochytrium tenue]
AYRNSAEILGIVEYLYKSTVDFLGRLLRARDIAIEWLKRKIEEYIQHSTDVIEFLYDKHKSLAAAVNLKEFVTGTLKKKIDEYKSVLAYERDEYSSSLMNEVFRALHKTKMEKKVITFELDGTLGFVTIFAIDTIHISWFKSYLSSQHKLRDFSILVKISEDPTDTESAPFNQDDQTFSRLVDENRTFEVVRARSSSGAGNHNEWKKHVAAADYICGKGSAAHILTICYADCDSKFVTEVSEKLSVKVTQHFAAIRKTCLGGSIEWIQRVKALGSSSMALFICSNKAVEEFVRQTSKELCRRRKISVMPIYFDDDGLEDDTGNIPDVNHRHLASPNQLTIREIRTILADLVSNTVSRANCNELVNFLHAKFEIEPELRRALVKAAGTEYNHYLRVIKHARGSS